MIFSTVVKKIRADCMASRRVSYSCGKSSSFRPSPMLLLYLIIFSSTQDLP
jgi:hypothetical protein